MAAPSARHDWRSGPERGAPIAVILPARRHPPPSAPIVIASEARRSRTAAAAVRRLRIAALLRGLIDHVNAHRA
jgi:hypothetical protein